MHKTGRISTLDLREIVRWLRSGQGDRRVARELGLSRNTVKKYRAWAEGEGLLECEQLPDLTEVEARREAALPKRENGPESVVEPYREYVEQKRADGVELVALHRLLRERGFTGSYSSVRRFVARLERRTPEKYLRVETSPGEEAQVDFGYVGYLRDAVTGRKRKAWVFVMTLSFSRHQYAEIVFDQRVETWVRLHVSAFESFGGLVKRVVIDNLKAGIVKAVIHDAAAQRSYRELAEHYDFLISPCRPYTPRHKGKVESGVHYVKRNALAGREFRDIVEANAYLERWVQEVAGQRDHGTTHETPLSRFEREAPALRELPRQRYEVSVWKKAKVHPDCHVVFDYSYYSAPHRIVGEHVWLRATGSRVELFHHFERLTSHARAQRHGEWVTNLDHYPPEKVAGLLPEPIQVREDSRRVGPRTGEFVDRLLGDRAMDRLRGAQAVLRLAKRFGQKRLEAACQRALAFDEIRVHTIKNILKRGLEQEDVGGDSEQLHGPLPKTSRFARSAAELIAQN